MTSNPMKMGLAAAQARNVGEAIGWFRKALAETPDDPVAKAWLGQSLCLTGDRVAGVALLREAARQFVRPPASEPDVPRALETIAQLQGWGDFEGALEFCRLAVQAAPDDMRAHQVLAVTCGQVNLTTEGLAAGERALQLQPDQPMMQVLQGSLEADAGQNAQARRRLEGVIAAGAPVRESFRAHKELARVVDALGDYAQVFPHIEAAAALAPQLLEFRSQDPRQIPAMIDSNFDGFDAELLGRWSAADFADEKPAPAFIIGFFRSGTTLTQEVLATHPDVFVADEAGLVWDMKGELNRMVQGSAPTAQKLRVLDLAGVRRLREAYWRYARGRFGDAVDRPLFVDKFTMNTLDIGVINVVFPDARVVFMMRDPRDVCLSCVTQLMVPTPSTIHLLTWRGAATFYALVMDWWMHVRELLTLEFVEVRYEDAVSAFEPTYRPVFEFLGLDWDPRVIDFHLRAAGKFIASPSRNQVSRPLYGSSVARWRRFESRYAEVADLLDPFAQELGYPA
jgi:tetratricopeptide (TPR) repeat protein